MGHESAGEITRLSQGWRGGDRKALVALLPVVYKELQRLAHFQLRKERPDHTLQSAALVNEAYFRLVGLNAPQWEGRSHFFAIAAQQMRQILVDYARRHRAGKRGGVPASGTEKQPAWPPQNEMRRRRATRRRNIVSGSERVEVHAGYWPASLLRRQKRPLLAETQYRAHPNSFRRIATSFAKQFFGREAVSLIDEGRVECYMTWRVKEHKVRGVTLRHNLHALSKFFGHAIKQHWARENPIRNVKIPSDEDAVRIHVLTTIEELQYFTRAAKHRDLHDLGRLTLNQDEVTSLAKADVLGDRQELPTCARLK